MAQQPGEDELIDVEFPGNTVLFIIRIPLWLLQLEGIPFWDYHQHNFNLLAPYARLPIRYERDPSDHLYNPHGITSHLF